MNPIHNIQRAVALLSAIATAVAFALCLAFCLVGDAGGAMIGAVAAVLLGLATLLCQEPAQPRQWRA